MLTMYEHFTDEALSRQLIIAATERKGHTMAERKALMLEAARRLDRERIAALVASLNPDDNT